MNTSDNCLTLTIESLGNLGSANISLSVTNTLKVNSPFNLSSSKH